MSSRSLVVMMACVFSRTQSGRRDSEGFLPIVLHGRRKFLDAREKSCDLPHFFLTEGFVPRRHAGIANAGADSVIGVPLGVVERSKNELRGRGVERFLQWTWLVVEGAVTERAVHGVNFHTLDQIFIQGRDRIVNPWGMTLH